MSKIKIDSAFYDMDYNIINSTDTNGKYYLLDCDKIFNSLNLSSTTKIKLHTLKEQNLKEFVELYLNNELQEYADTISKNIVSINEVIFANYKEKYPTMSDSQINSLIKEFNMYDS